MKLIAALLLCAAALGAQTRPALAYSKVFGGNGTDIATAVATDPVGNSYVAGQTTSTDFPVVNGLQAHIGGTPLRVSTDNGQTWAAPAIGAGVTSLAGSGSTLFAGTFGKLYKSTDSGKTWSVLPSFPQIVVNAVAADGTAVYTGTGNGVLKSLDGGANWQPANQGFGIYLDVATLIARDGTLFASVYASTPSPSLYRSVDGGANWSAVGNAPQGIFVFLTFDATNANIVYGTVSPGLAYSSGSPSVYKTTDGGASWAKIADGNAAIAVSSTAIFLAGPNGVQRSTNGGATWSATGLTAATGAIAVDPNDPQRVYADALGILASADGGITWKPSLSVRQVVKAMLVTSGKVFVGAVPGQNVFVTKWSADGKQMLYSTYLGGSLYDYATGIAVDHDGNAYVTGYTTASDFPVTPGSLQTTAQGTTTPFVAKIAPDGSTLKYSTYLPASGSSNAIALDAGGAAYLTGMVPCVVNPFTPNNNAQAFVDKIAPDGASLQYATILGSSCGSDGLGITVDPAGNAYAVGAELSSPGAVTNSGFLAKISPSGGLAYAAHLGGSGNDLAQAVALDPQGNIYVTGSSFGFDSVMYAGCGSASSLAPGFQILSGGAAYVLKLDPKATTRLYLEYLGGCFGIGRSLAVDSGGRAWVAGLTGGQNFPTVHPFQALQLGQGFLTQLSADGSAILFSSMTDSANGMALDASGNAVVAGSANSSTSPFLLKTSAELVRVAGAVQAAVTVEAPQKFVAPDPAAPPENGVAPGEIIVITGANLGPSQEALAQFTPTGTVATSLAGTTVTFGGIPAPLISVQAQRVVCIVPLEVNYPGTSMQITSSSGQSNEIRMANLLSAVEVIAVVNQDGSLNTASHPAAPGSIATIYAAGFGQTFPASVNGAINGNDSKSLLVGPVGVHINDQDAAIDYAGPAPGQVAGVVQINFTVPRSLIPSQYSAYVGWGLQSFFGAGSSGSSTGAFGDFGTATIFVGPQ